LIAGVLAGFLGALVGIGGGVILVPLLNGVMGLPFPEATAVSLVGVLGTSSSAVMTPPSRRLLNTRLAILLLLFSVTGAMLGARVLTDISDDVKKSIFGVTAGVIAAMMFVRLNKRNVRPLSTVNTGILGGQVYDDDLKTTVVYRVRRLPVAMVASFVAGILSSLVGIGGGILIVPVLNSLCGVPLRVAAATSVLMIGVTAIPGVAAHWAGGYLNDFHLAALATVGTVVGFQIGQFAGPRAPVLWLKATMGVILTGVALQYLLFR